MHIHDSFIKLNSQSGEELLAQKIQSSCSPMANFSSGKLLLAYTPIANPFLVNDSTLNLRMGPLSPCFPIGSVRGCRQRAMMGMVTSGLCYGRSAQVSPAVLPNVTCGIKQEQALPSVTGLLNVESAVWVEMVPPCCLSLPTHVQFFSCHL